MLKPLRFFVLIMLFAANRSFGAQVSSDTAGIVAVNFFKGVYTAYIDSSLTARLAYVRNQVDGTPVFYAFNIKPGPGFVIVSARNEVIPVLAYSDESYFDSAFSQYGMVNWVNKTTLQITNTLLQNIQADYRIKIQWANYLSGINPVQSRGISVGPLLSTSWNQLPLYNDDCPLNPNDGQLSVTGCVATAMAQIMKYWNYPPKGVGSFSYVDDQAHGDQNNIGTLSANFATTGYKWTQMPAYLVDTNSAVALLMSQCGISVAMDYSDEGSGAWVLQEQADAVYGYNNAPCAQYSYANYFLYNPNTIQGVFQSDYTTNQWLNLIEGEMNSGRVVQYQGTDPYAGGHTWVCDGYDANDNLHMNWGWGGIDNGFFAVTDLSAGGYTFDDDDAALIGIEPLHNADTTCTISASFTFQSRGGNTVQFTNGSISNHAFTTNWSFANAQGQFTTSSQANPLINFIGQAPYTAELIVSDTFYGGCRDTALQTIVFNPNTTCITIQNGKTHLTGADISSLFNTILGDYTTNADLMSNQWTNAGRATEDRGLMHFDLSQIPTGSTIISAKLNLYANPNADNGFAGSPTYGSNNASNLLRITGPWDPATVDWNTQPSFTTNGAVLLQQSTNDLENYLNLDISAFVQAWVDSPQVNYGMVLKLITSNYYNCMIFCSPAYPDSTQWPELNICYIPPPQCSANASFVPQNLGNGQVLFTNTSTDNMSFTSQWYFFDSTGQISSSSATNPSITFSGQPPYRAMLVISDSICSDTTIQIVNLSNCIAIQDGNSHAIGADISSLFADVNGDFTTVADLMSNEWTNGGRPTEDRALFKFDLSNIPVGSAIISAELNLYANDNAGNGINGEPTYGTNNASYLYLIDSTWNPATVTWNTKPPISTNGAVLLPQSTGTNENYLNINVSNFVQGWVNNPSTNYGMMLELISPQAYNSLIFCSPAVGDSTKWPQLNICYQIAAPCHLNASFTQQSLGSGVVQFTNTSGAHAVCNWNFYNGSGLMTTSVLANPLITFTGVAPFSATLFVNDTITGCTDSVQQTLNLTACLNLQQQKAVTGATINSFSPGQNMNFTGYDDFEAEQYTVGGNPAEDRGLIRFNLSQVPTGSVISSAYLSLFADTISGQGYPGQPTYGSNNASYLHLITSPWDPATVTWNTQPAISDSAVVLIPQSVNTSENYLNLNINSFVQQWVDSPTKNYGMLLKMITQTDYNSMIFCSSGYPIPAKQPLLQICYFIPAECAISDSFTYTIIGADSIQFSNLASAQHPVISSWQFYNSTGVIGNSTETSPMFVFSGNQPYSASLLVYDNQNSECIDSFGAPVRVTNGINTETGTGNLFLYPNPSGPAEVYIQLPDGFNPDFQIKVFDALARQVPISATKISVDLYRISFDNNLPNGFYTVTVSNVNIQQSCKLVVIR